MKILENRDAFSVPEYAAVATSFSALMANSVRHSVLRAVLSRGLIAGFLMHRFASGFDAVVTVGPRVSLGYGIACRMFGRTPACHIAREFYLTRDSFSGWHAKLYRWALKHLDALVVNASAEVDTYSALLNLRSGSVIFIPWPSNITNVSRASPSGSYCLAAGRSFRDWETLASAAATVSCPVSVVAARRDVARISWPDNVTLYTDIPRSEYIDLLEGSQFVVVPLIPTDRSTGQATFLEAMSLGKPVVVADVSGARDYLTQDVTALLYDPLNPRDLAVKMETMATDESLRDRLAAEAMEAVRTRFNKESYVRDLLTLVGRLCNSDRQGQHS